MSRVTDEELILILDKLAEQTCCEHGINNSVKAKEDAIKSLRLAFNKNEAAVADLYTHGEVYTGKRGS